MLTPEHRAHLCARSYIPELIDKEPISSEDDLIVWECRSPSGALIGHQTARTDRHEYRWIQAEQAHHLPIIYGVEEDHDLLYQTGSVILVEGIFDRAAMKRAVPNHACYARLSKGIAKHLLTLLRRYATTVYLCFDQDGPGEAATIDAENKLRGGPETHRIKIPAKDPAALLERIGERRAEGIIRPQVTLWEN